MTCILGIDPGSRITGYGLIKIDGRKIIYLDAGVIQASDEDFPLRLKTIFLGVRDVVARYSPQEAAIEQVFMHANAGSALKLGQARGAAIVALADEDIPVAEYTARQIKQSVVGYGNADKSQVAFMVNHLLQLNETIRADASDALATAMCHAHARGALGGLMTGRSYRRGRVW